MNQAFIVQILVELGAIASELRSLQHHETINDKPVLMMNPDYLHETGDRVNACVQQLTKGLFGGEGRDNESR